MMSSNLVIATYCVFRKDTLRHFHLLGFRFVVGYMPVVAETPKPVKHKDIL